MTSICFFNATRFWGGGEKWHFDAARYLASRGHRVYFIAHPKGELYKRISDTPIISGTMTVSNLSFLNPYKIWKLAGFFRSKQIRTVVFNGSSEAKIGAVAARLAGVKAIVYRRGLAVPVRNSALNRLIYGKLITHFLTNSRATAQTLFKYLSIPSAERKIRTIYNGIDLSIFSCPIETSFPGKNKKNIVLGSAGRLEKQKGHSFLIETASRLQHAGLDFQLLIAGEGPLRKPLQDRITEFELDGVVKLTGFVRNVPVFLKQIDIFVFPSLWEGFGYAIAEAMAVGIPVVAFETSSNPEIIEQGVTGFMVPVGNAESLTDKILLLAKDPDLRIKMGRNGKERVRRLFDQAAQSSALETYLCEEVLGITQAAGFSTSDEPRATVPDTDE